MGKRRREVTPLFYAYFLLHGCLKEFGSFKKFEAAIRWRLTDIPTKLKGPALLGLFLDIQEEVEFEKHSKKFNFLVEGNKPGQATANALTLLLKDWKNTRENLEMQEEDRGKIKERKKKWLFSDENLDRVVREINEEIRKGKRKPTIKEDLDRLKGVFQGKNKGK